MIDGQRVEGTEKRLEPFGMQRSIFGRAVDARGFVARAIDGNTATSRRTNEPSRAFYCDRENERSESCVAAEAACSVVYEIFRGSIVGEQPSRKASKSKRAALRCC